MHEIVVHFDEFADLAYGSKGVARRFWDLQFRLESLVLCFTRIDLPLSLACHLRVAVLEFRLHRVGQLVEREIEPLQSSIIGDDLDQLVHVRCPQVVPTDVQMNEIA